MKIGHENKKLFDISIYLIGNNYINIDENEIKQQFIKKIQILCFLKIKSNLKILILKFKWAEEKMAKKEI